MGNIIISSTNVQAYSVCDDPDTVNTIEIEHVALNDQLTELDIKAFGCGEFVQVDVWVGDAYVNGSSPFTFIGARLSQLDCSDESEADNPLCDGESDASSDGSVLIMSITAEELGSTTGILDDFFVVALHTKRCFNDLGVREKCDFLNDGINEDVCVLDCQTAKFEEVRIGVASYGSIYPALVDKIMHIDSGCAACSEMNDALTMDMLVKACSIYLTVDRVEEAWDAYQKVRQLSQDYEDLFRKGPTACQTFGGIGCWLIDHNFVVAFGTPYVVPGVIRPPK